MDKRILLIILFFVHKISAQVPNNSFESWTNENPDSWQTTNIPIVPVSILPDSDAYNGSLSVKGIVVTATPEGREIVNTLANGVVGTITTVTEGSPAATTIAKPSTS